MLIIIFFTPKRQHISYKNTKHCPSFCLSVSCRWFSTTVSARQHMAVRQIDDIMSTPSHPLGGFPEWPGFVFATNAHILSPAAITFGKIANQEGKGFRVDGTPHTPRLRGGPQIWGQIFILHLCTTLHAHVDAELRNLAR